MIGYVKHLHSSWLHLLPNSYWLSLLIVMANFITTVSKLTSLADYPFWKICVKLVFGLITYSGTFFIVEDILNILALS